MKTETRRIAEHYAEHPEDALEPEFEIVARALIAVEDLAIALCEAKNETEQNYYRKKLGVLLCGWPE